MFSFCCFLFCCHITKQNKKPTKRKQKASLFILFFFLCNMKQEVEEDSSVPYASYLINQHLDFV